jgi:NADH-quinone oxidoreductase subunit L
MAVLAYFLYVPTPMGVRQSLHELLFSGFYLDRFYQQVIVRPYQGIAKFLWLKIDEGSLDEGIDRTGNLFPFFSMGLRLWTTGRMSTYLRMLLLGFTAILCALAIGWYSW